MLSHLIDYRYNFVDEVAYATALDVFIIICSILVFFALAEFALLSFLDVYIRKAKCQKQFKILSIKFQTERKTFFLFRRYKEREQKFQRQVKILKRARMMEKSFCIHRKHYSHDNHPRLNGDPYDPSIGEAVCHSRSVRSVASYSQHSRADLLSLEETLKAGPGLCYWDERLQASDLYRSTLDYLHHIDSVSRKLFPFTFLLCNLVYWTSYIYVL